MENTYVLGVDIGGSHIACQLVDLKGCRPLKDSYTEIKVAENETARVILSAWEKALDSCLRKVKGIKVAGIGVAIPSPFDFVNGIAMADHKFAALKGMNIREELHRVTGIKQECIFFTNDAAAFGMGVWRMKEGAGRHILGVTLGTGFGACFIVDGCYAIFGPGVPVGGELWNWPFRGMIAEDYVSTRWFERRFKELTGEQVKGMKGVVGWYEQGKYSREVELIFTEFADAFGEIVLPFIHRFQADALVIGGGMVLADQYFLPQVKQYFVNHGMNISVITIADTTSAIIVGAAALCD